MQGQLQRQMGWGSYDAWRMSSHHDDAVTLYQHSVYNQDGKNVGFIETQSNDEDFTVIDAQEELVNSGFVESKIDIQDDGYVNISGEDVYSFYLAPESKQTSKILYVAKASFNSRQD